MIYQDIRSSTQVASDNLMTDMSNHFANLITLHSSKKSKLTDRPKVRISGKIPKTTLKT